MNEFPLNLFLTSLTADGIALTARDYKRLVLAFQTQSRWTLARLKNVLSVILAKDTDQQRLIARKFDKFFKAETEAQKNWPEIDVQLLLNQLKAVGAESGAGAGNSTEMGMGPMGTGAEPDSGPMPDTRHAFANKQAIKASQADNLKKTSRKYLRWILGTVMVVAVLVFVFIRFSSDSIDSTNKAQTSPAAQAKLEISHLTHNFGIQELNKPAQGDISLTNKGNAPLIIKSIRIHETENSQDTKVFKIPELSLPQSLTSDQLINIPVTFTPKAAQNYRAELQIIHNAEEGSDTFSLLGTGKGAAPTEAKRLYPDVPYVKDIIYEALERSKEWQIYAGISALILLLSLLYALHLWNLAKGPKSKRSLRKAKEQTDWSEKGPLFFHPGTIGGKPSPWLNEETLSYLADSMGYFKTAQPGKSLNIPASIKATVKQGGIPEPRFEKQKQIQTLLILEDEYAEAMDWNPISGELAQGMQRYGVPVIYGRFRGSPERFRTLDGMVYHLDELEDQRRGILLLLFTDGKVFHRPQTGFALETLARWPQIAWIELRNQKIYQELGDESISLTSKNKIPIYPGTSQGLIQAVKKFTSEQGKSKEAEPESKPGFSQENLLISQADARYDAWVEYFLADALLWVQDCSIMQPITPGLADKLRQKFHPHIKAEQIECLYSLPNTTITDSGLRFSDENMRILRRGFLQRRKEDEQKKVLQFILKQIEKSKPDAPEDSLAYLSWEAAYERVRLEFFAGSEDLKTFDKLLKSELSEFIADSFKNYDFADQHEGRIPVLRKPKSNKAINKLQQVFYKASSDNYSEEKNLFNLFFVISSLLRTFFTIVYNCVSWLQDYCYQYIENLKFLYQQLARIIYNYGVGFSKMMVRIYKNYSNTRKNLKHYAIKNIPKNLFFWLAGSRTDILLQCPEEEQRKHVAIGVTVLIPTLFAFAASFFMISTLTDKLQYTIPIACLWAFITLSIDRILLASYRAYAPLKVRLAEFTIRMIIALAIAFTISHPAVLFVFHEALELQLKNNYEEQVKIIQKEAEKRKKEIIQKTGNLYNDEERILETNISTQYSASSVATANVHNEELKAIFESFKKKAGNSIVNLNKQRDILIGNREKFQKLAEEYFKKLEDEEAGVSESRMAGRGPEWHKINYEQYQPTLQKLKEIDQKITDINFQMKEIRESLEKVQVTQINLLKERYEEQTHEFITSIRKVEDETNERIEKLEQHLLKPDILSLSLTLNKIMEKNTFAFIAYIFIVLTFALVNVSAVLIKFLMKPGLYDKLVNDLEKSHEYHRKIYEREYKTFIDIDSDAPPPSHHTKTIREMIKSDIATELQLIKSKNENKLNDDS